MSNDPNKPDFSNVQANVETLETPKPDFGNVHATVETVAVHAGAQTYTVASGDNLSKIAKKFLGDANRWHAIYEANRDKISNPDLIHPGQVLIIPAATPTQG